MEQKIQPTSEKHHTLKDHGFRITSASTISNEDSSVEKTFVKKSLELSTLTSEMMDEIQGHLNFVVNPGTVGTFELPSAEMVLSGSSLHEDRAQLTFCLPDVNIDTTDGRWSIARRFTEHGGSNSLVLVQTLPDDEQFEFVSQSVADIYVVMPNKNGWQKSAG